MDGLDEIELEMRFQRALATLAHISARAGDERTMLDRIQKLPVRSRGKYLRLFALVKRLQSRD